MKSKKNISVISNKQKIIALQICQNSLLQKMSCSLFHSTKLEPNSNMKYFYYLYLTWSIFISHISSSLSQLTLMASLRDIFMTLNIYYLTLYFNFLLSKTHIFFAITWSLFNLLNRIQIIVKWPTRATT